MVLPEASYCSCLGVFKCFLTLLEGLTSKDVTSVQFVKAQFINDMIHMSKNVSADRTCQHMSGQIQNKTVKPIKKKHLTLT